MNKKTLFSGILAGACLFCSSAATQWNSAPKQGDIVIDGKLDEPAWQKASRFDDFRSIVNVRPKLVCKTEFRVMHDAENVYVGVTVRDPDMKHLRASVKGYDVNPWRDDIIELFLSPGGRSTEYYQFVFAAGGGWWCHYYEESGFISPDPYRPFIRSAVYKNDKFWSLEIQLPLRAFYMTPPDRWQTEWPFNVARGRLRKGESAWENASWSPLKSGFREPHNFRRMGGFPVKTEAMHSAITNVFFQAEKNTKSGSLTGKIKLDITVPKSGDFLLAINNLPPVRMSLRRGYNKITCPMEYPAEGRQRTTLILRDESGKIYTERMYPVSVAFQPLQIFFDRPFYSNCFFPGQDSSRLTGRVEIKAVTENPSLTLQVADRKYQLPVKNGQAPFDIDISTLKSSDFQVKAIYGGYSRSARIRKIGKQPNRILWIENGRLMLDGKPVFLRAWYAGTTRANDSYNCSILMNERYAPATRKMPLYFPDGRCAIEPCDISRAFEAAEATKDIRPSKKMLDFMKKTIERWRGRDFFAYYLSDEPECRGISRIYLKHCYDYIKDLDPTHPVMIISRSPAAYMNCCDVMSVHPYVCPEVDSKGRRSYHRDFFNVNRVCAEGGACDLSRKILMITPGAYGSLWANVNADYENFDEVCANVWIAAANGATGVFPYIWYDHATRPEMSMAYDYVFRSLERLEKQLTAPGDARKLEKDNNKIAARLTVPFGKVMLVIVNLDTTEQSVCLKAPELKNCGPLHVFRENRTLKPENGCLRLKLKPLQSLVLTQEKLDQGMVTLQETRKAVEKANADRASRGNLLFGKAAKSVDISSSAGNSYALREYLFNGCLEGAAWLPRRYSSKEQFLQFSFTDEVPRFSKIRIWGANCERARIKYWKYGEWVTPEFKLTTPEKYLYEFDFGKTISTVKLRVEFPVQRKKLEIYEFELLK